MQRKVYRNNRADALAARLPRGKSIRVVLNTASIDFPLFLSYTFQKGANILPGEGLRWNERILQGGVACPRFWRYFFFALHSCRCRLRRRKSRRLTCLPRSFLPLRIPMTAGFSYAVGSRRRPGIFRAAAHRRELQRGVSIWHERRLQMVGASPCSPSPARRTRRTSRSICAFLPFPLAELVRQSSPLLRQEATLLICRVFTRDSTILSWRRSSRRRCRSSAIRRRAKRWQRSSKRIPKRRSI